MAGVSNQFRQSDVTGWGIAAIACAGLAIVCANLTALAPQSLTTALHVPHANGVSLAQLRQQVAELRTETALLRRQNELLATRFALQEQTGSEVVRRVGALEVSMPSLLDTPLPGSGVDRSTTTASIGTPGQMFDAQGGSVLVRQSPMPPQLTNSDAPAPYIAALPNLPASDQGYGVSIGSSFAAGQGHAQWLDMQVRLGSLLLEMAPLVTPGSFAGEERLVVGPMGAVSSARDLCARVEQVNISCSPVAYEGTPLSQ
ncbi:hypothetical protein SAMN05216456_1257 [Devosia crocina]|uniref:SPOR domain-containing protein n=1 Tax=Devosia crocina TaxID=429728 RepID=A0A1I7N927_9HYPH|nr:hypothetical protein SAMN05216456_1257 [Devosia crocina]